MLCKNASHERKPISGCALPGPASRCDDVTWRAEFDVEGLLGALDHSTRKNCGPALGADPECRGHAGAH